MNSVVIVGAGRLGTSLGLALKEGGYSLQAISCTHQASAKESAQILGLTLSNLKPEEAIFKGNLIFLCVPDGKLASLIKNLAKAQLNLRGKFVYHTSGLFSSRILEPLKSQGARIASFHPIQSFPNKNTPTLCWKNIFIGLEGDRDALELAKKIINKIGAHHLLIGQRNKSLYHAACSLASNHFVALFSLAVSLLQESGLAEDEAVQALRPLVGGTWKNLESTDPASALTGPIVRADLTTIRRHLKTLEPHPLSRQIYRKLGLVALSLAEKKGLKQSQVRSLKRWLQDR